MKKILLVCSMLALVTFSLAAPDNLNLAEVNPCASSVYHGNTNTKKFHKESCRYYDCKACTRIFYSREEAIDTGFVPCKVCKP